MAKIDFNKLKKQSIDIAQSIKSLAIVLFDHLKTGIDFVITKIDTKKSLTDIKKNTLVSFVSYLIVILIAYHFIKDSGLYEDLANFHINNNKNSGSEISSVKNFSQDKKNYINDSNGTISDSDFNSALGMVNKMLPGILDDSKKVTGSPLCEAVHKSLSNKVMLLQEIQTYYIRNGIDTGIMLGKNSCQHIPGEDNVEFGLRENYAKSTYDIILQNCFVNGGDELVNLIKRAEPFSTISNCNSAQVFQNAAHRFIMNPKFDNYRSAIR